MVRGEGSWGGGVGEDLRDNILSTHFTRLHEHDVVGKGMARIDADVVIAAAAAATTLNELGH